MSEFDEAIKREVEKTLKDNFEYGKYSSEQFIRLEIDDIINEVNTAFNDVLIEKATIYTRTIGSEI